MVWKPLISALNNIYVHGYSLADAEADPDISDFRRNLDLMMRLLIQEYNELIGECVDGMDGNSFSGPCFDLMIGKGVIIFFSFFLLSITQSI
jgi:hypothetical protein